MFIRNIAGGRAETGATSGAKASKRGGLRSNHASSGSAAGSGCPCQIGMGEKGKSPDPSPGALHGGPCGWTDAHGFIRDGHDCRPLARVGGLSARCGFYGGMPTMCSATLPSWKRITDGGWTWISRCSVAVASGRASGRCRSGGVPASRDVWDGRTLNERITQMEP